jgi:murein DD-endopeptidase MepM/ murein hydrolase activator NlpD
MADTGRLPQRLGGRKIAGYGRGSKATGAYQFMPPTLEGLIRQGVLKPNELFTPETQDRAALALAANRGVTADVLKREGFSSNVSAKLAPEWASVPTTSGRSYYGQPVKAFSSLQKVYSQGLTENTTLGTTEPTKIVQVPAGNINPVVGDRLGAGRNHGGVDLAVNSGTPLRAISDGVIVDSDYNPGGWGNFLVMKDDRGIYHLYGHMQSGYKRRGSVKKGEVIGKVGMTGRWNWMEWWSYNWKV